MHHLIFGINFQIHSVSLTILVSIHLLIHLSTHLSLHSRSHHPSLLHSFTPAQNLPFQQILPTLNFFYLLDFLVINGLDWTYHAHHFIFSFTFYLFFIPCGRLSWLPISFLLHIKYVHHVALYRIISYEIGQWNRDLNII